MLTKQQKYLQRQWIRGTVNLSVLARRFGYKGAALQKGVAKVRLMLRDMGIPVTE